MQDSCSFPSDFVHQSIAPPHVSTVVDQGRISTLTGCVTTTSSRCRPPPRLGLVEGVISYFTTAKILDKRSSAFGDEYRCELKPLWLPAELVKEVPMGGVHLRSYENGFVRADRLGTLRDRKEEAFTNVSVLSDQLSISVPPCTGSL
jgi:hypothetical protein